MVGGICLRWLFVVTLLASGVACTRFSAEEKPAKLTPIPNSLAGQSLACGMFPTSLITEALNLPPEQIAEVFPNRSYGGNGSGDTGVPGDCRLYYRFENDPKMEFRYGHLMGGLIPGGDELRSSYEYLAEAENRISLPSGLGTGFYSDGRGAYMTYPCGKKGPIYVQLFYGEELKKTKLADVLPLLKIMDEEVKKASSCV